VVLATVTMVFTAFAIRRPRAAWDRKAAKPQEKIASDFL